MLQNITFWISCKMSFRVAGLCGTQAWGVPRFSNRFARKVSRICRKWRVESVKCPIWNAMERLMVDIGNGRCKPTSFTGRHHLLLDMPCGYQCLYVWCSTLVCNMHLLNLFYFFHRHVYNYNMYAHTHPHIYIYIHYQDLCVGWFPKIGVPQNHPLWSGFPL